MLPDVTRDGVAPLPGYPQICRCGPSRPIPPKLLMAAWFRLVTLEFRSCREEGSTYKAECDADPDDTCALWPLQAAAGSASSLARVLARKAFRWSARCGTTPYSPASYCGEQRTRAMQRRCASCAQTQVGSARWHHAHLDVTLEFMRRLAVLLFRPPEPAGQEART